jgi:hypothetical protein
LKKSVKAALAGIFVLEVSVALYSLEGNSSITEIYPEPRELITSAGFWIY